jgi:hypothetical protein
MRFDYRTLIRLGFISSALVIAHFAACVLLPFSWLRLPLGVFEISVRRFILRSCPWPFPALYSRFDFEMGYVWILGDGVFWALSLLVVGYFTYRCFHREQTIIDAGNCALQRNCRPAGRSDGSGN